MFKRCYFQEPLTEFKLRGRCQYFINALFSIFLSFSHFPPEAGYVSNRPGVGKRGPQNKLCCLYSYGPWGKNSFIFSNVKRKEETKRINVPHPVKVIWNANINVLLFGFIWTQPTHSFQCCLWLQSHRHRGEWWQERTCSPHSLQCLLSDPLRSLLAPRIDQLNCCSSGS